MMPSHAFMMSASAGIASARSILAMRSAVPPEARMSSRAMYMSAPLLGKDTARKSAFMREAVRTSSMSLGVSAGAVRPPPWRLIPLWLESVPPWRVTVWISSPRTSTTSSSSLPSSRSSTSPPRTSRGSSL